MLIAGIIGRDGRTQTAGLINSILTARGIRTSVVDSGNLAEMEPNIIKNYLRELENNETDILVIKINILDVHKESFGGLHFNILICTDKAEDAGKVEDSLYSQLMRRVLNSVDEKGTIIINMDDAEIVQFLDGLKNHIVTYGFNPKASITASSVGDTLFKDGFICCLQRTISARNGDLIEPQEYRIDISAGDFETDNLLAAVSFAVVNGIDLN